MIHLKKYVLCTNNWYFLAQIYEEKKMVESELLYQFLSIVSNFALKWYKRKRMMIHLKKYVAYSNNWYFLAQIFEEKKK